jgi:hypothetical protein
VVKKEMAKWMEQVEELDHAGKTDTNEYNHVDFMHNYLNAKQKALKQKKGTIEITYANYVINQGVSNSMF